MGKTKVRTKKQCRTFSVRKNIYNLGVTVELDLQFICLICMFNIP